VTAWIATVIGAITLISLLATLAVRAIKNETIKAVTENNLALKDRAQELGAEKDELQKHLAEVKGQRYELERQLRETPDFSQVVELFNQGISHLDEIASKRQETFVQMVITEIGTHNANVVRHYEEMAVLEKQRGEINEQILKALTELSEAVRAIERNGHENL
jgi:uncharacterized coiled-coil DUF342 family protein